MSKYKKGDIVKVEYDEIKLEVKITNLLKNGFPELGIVKRIIKDEFREWEKEKPFEFEEDDKIKKIYTKTKITSFKIKAKNKTKMLMLIKKTI